MRRISLALALLGAVAAGAGCSGGNNPNSSGSSRGVPGSTFTVAVRGDGYWFDPVSSTTVNRPQFGTVTSSPAGINCGPAATACSADFAWGTAVTLSAAGSTGYGFHAFAGACSGTADCALSGNADKTVVVRFATSGEGIGGHPNYSDPAVHGPKYMEFASGTPGALTCTQCHGATLQGQGIALSCAACHAAPTPPGATEMRAEGCVTCHEGQGATHQAAYDRYTDTSDLAIAINSIVSVDPDLDGTYTSTMTFTVTKAGAPFTGSVAALPQKTFYAATYDSATRKFNKSVSYSTPTAVAGSPGVFTVTATKETSGATGTNVSSALNFKPEDGPSIAFTYVTDGAMTFEAFTVYDNVGHDGQEFGTVDYVSAANVAGCERCHGSPYMKHGYRPAHTADLDDFSSCKICHYDTRNGGHQAWQLLVDDPAAYAAQGGVLTPAQNALYPYKASVMNDVHMSHAMEFAYPQTMANCVTCHEGKLAATLADANFTLATCKSCHPVTGTGGTDPKRAPALTAIMPSTIHQTGGVPWDLYTYAGTCNNCHQTGVIKPFSEMHTGYNKVIYADTAGTKYSEAFTATITNASVAGNVLSFTATVTENIDVPGLSVANFAPTAYVAPYGFGTKQFILAAKNTGLNAPAAGWTATTTETATTKSWAVTFDIAVVGSTAWTDRITNNTIDRLALGLRPTLQTTFPGDTAATTLAQNIVTRTFDLDANAFDDAFYAPVVDANKCNACHEALGTTFHSADRGGNVVGCRLCHTPLSGGSHLEMQSRSIDSYVHAIHSMQPFDSGDVNFADPVAALKYDHHVESTYPNFTLLNCESCHNPGTYEAPDHSMSLPGILSANDVWDTGRTRTIGTVASVVTGPAARACGSCHRAHMINEDAATELAGFDAHTAAFGYRDTPGNTTTLEAVIAKIQQYIDYLLP